MSITIVPAPNTVGPQGPAGPTGPQGPAGATGPAGAAGANGLNTDGYRVGGLLGRVNAGSPTTKFDISADIVVLRNPDDGTVIVIPNTGVLTNDITVVGSTANGRDQAGAFSASSWIHEYFICKADGSGLATLSSVVAPPTGPTRPSTYTHWAYAGGIRIDASVALVETVFHGNKAWLVPAAVLAAGQATSFTTVDCSALVPPNSRVAIVNFQGVFTSDFTKGVFREPGQTHPGYEVVGNGQNAPNFAVNLDTVEVPLDANQHFEYKVNTGSASNLLYAGLQGYKMPNGGE